MEPGGAVGEDGDPPPRPPPPPPERRRRRRRTWWHHLAVVAVAVATAAGALVVLAAILLALAVSHGGDGTSNGLRVTNRTGEDLTIVYLASARLVSNGHVIDRRGTTDLGVAKADLI